MQDSCRHGVFTIETTSQHNENKKDNTACRAAHGHCNRRAKQALGKQLLSFHRFHQQLLRQRRRCGGVAHGLRPQLLHQRPLVGDAGHCLAGQVRPGLHRRRIIGRVPVVRRACAGTIPPGAEGAVALRFCIRGRACAVVSCVERLLLQRCQPHRPRQRDARVQALRPGSGTCRVLRAQTLAVGAQVPRGAARHQAPAWHKRQLSLPGRDAGGELPLLPARFSSPPGGKQ